MDPQPLLASKMEPRSSNYRIRPSQARIHAMKYGMLATCGGLLVIASILFISSTTKSSINDVMTPNLSSKKSSKNPPNVVFILADDMGYGSLSSDVTPFMHGLSNKGVSLESYYSQETCTPARAALLTGRYPLSIGVQFYEQGVAKLGGLPDDETTLAELLQDEGYTTYMLGKWNLGNSSPNLLPTARGFDYYLGFLDAYNHYWSKSNPDYPDFTDFMYSDSSCYYQYDGDDMKTYSTTIFGNAAVSAITGHDYDKSSMFLYVSLQAARAPFDDENNGGLEDSYLEEIDAEDANSYINKKVEGNVQKQYFKSVAVMDKTVENIYNALDDVDQLDNSYIIFASDNGGCPTAGGRNYPLRGTKGSLFEGGTKVESFVYSPLFSSKVQGSTYSNVFHVSDWFPTILDMASVKYSPKSKYALDGVSHYDAMVDGKDAPRDYMLYNYYYDASDSKKDLWSGQAMAIRNDRYKLMHTYESPSAAAWYSASEAMKYDDDFTSYDGCAQFSAIQSGQFQYYLFDLKEDPNEETNLYGSSDKYTAIQDELYDALGDIQDNAADYCTSGDEASSAQKEWKSNDNYVVPWTDSRRRLNLQGSKTRRLSSKYPDNCGLWSDSYEQVASDQVDSSTMQSSHFMKSSGKTENGVSTVRISKIKTFADVYGLLNIFKSSSSSSKSSNKSKKTTKTTKTTTSKASSTSNDKDKSNNNDSKKKKDSKEAKSSSSSSSKSSSSKDKKSAKS